jgi:hypothetical protein
MIALIVHSVAALIGLLHWIFVWQTSPVDGGNTTMEGTFYSWCLLFSVLAFIGAIVVNLVVDRKKGNAKLTSFVSIGAAVLGLYYIIAWWVGDTAEAIRKAEDNDLFKYKGIWKFGRILYWFWLILCLAGGAIPAVMGGLVGGNKI